MGFSQKLGVPFWGIPIIGSYNILEVYIGFPPILGKYHIVAYGDYVNEEVGSLGPSNGGSSVVIDVFLFLLPRVEVTVCLKWGGTPI